MRFARPLHTLLAAAACTPLLACPLHSITIAAGDPGHDPGPPVVHEGSVHGPPPHAPAHGYRHKHQRAYQARAQTVDLVFDSGLGVYVVVGIPNYYYWNGVYLRLDRGAWSQAQYLDASWAPCGSEAVPTGLRAKAEKPAGGKTQGKWKSKGKGHGRGAAKRSDDQ